MNLEHYEVGNVLMSPFHTLLSPLDKYTCATFKLFQIACCLKQTNKRKQSHTRSTGGDILPPHNVI